jgi:hypothetical protein
MKQLAKCLSLVLFGSAAIAAGCSTTAATPADGGLSGVGGSSSHLQPLLPDATGFVDVGATGTTGIKGAWYAYGDGVGSNGTTATGDCEAKGLHAVSECSAITMPSFGSFPNTAGKMCTSGTVAKVIPIVGGTMPDYTQIWGAGIGLDLNNGGGEAGAVKGTYNATAAGVIGIAFDLDVVPLATMRVEFPNATATNAAFWGGDLQASPVKAGHNEIKWADVKGPFYDTAAPVFDPKTIYSIQFHVPTTGTSAAPYNFCISNLSAILAAAP